MSPNRPITNPLAELPELSSEIENVDLNQFVHQFNIASDDEDEHLVENGYVLLSQETGEQQTYELDDESESDDTSSDEEASTNQNSNYCRWNVEIQWNSDDNGEQPKQGPQEEQTQQKQQEEQNEINFEVNDSNLEINEESQRDERFQTYIANHLKQEDTPFQREYDKLQSIDEVNPINLDKNNIDTIKECMKKISLPVNSIPPWMMDSMNDSLISERLTNFIYKKAASK